MVPEWHLEQGAHKMSFGNGLEITFIDTPPFIKKYHKTKWANLIGKARGKVLIYGPEPGVWRSRLTF